MPHIETQRIVNQRSLLERDYVYLYNPGPGVEQIVLRGLQELP